MVFTVIIGALAVAVSFFVIFQHTYALYEVTHSSFWEFFVETLPFCGFGLCSNGYFAIYNLRHTKMVTAIRSGRFSAVVWF